MMVFRKNDAPLDFDFQQVTEQSRDNPVFYVQYAHARLCSMQRQALERGVSPPDAARIDLAPLSLPEEQGLLRHLSLYPSVVEASARLLEPHRLIFYLQELSGVLHAYYNKHRVLTDDRERSLARLALMRAIRTVLGNGLALAGVTAPERM
jgi:arginyl-tRNA synthetase